MTKISIIVPIYNVQDYLHRCINSVINQNIDSIELILVDDGSSDDSGSICDYYAGKHNNIKVIHQKNAGALIARINGVNHAKGEYICFIDSDDDIPSGCLSQMYQKAIEHNTDILATTTNRYINQKLVQVQKGSIFGQVNKIDYAEGMLREATSMSMCAKLFKRELFNNHCYDNFPKDITQNEDLLMNLMLLPKVTNIYICRDIVGYNYYLSGNSMSQNLREEKYWVRLFGMIKELLVNEYNYNDNSSLQKAFALYKLGYISALSIKQKGDLKEFNIKELLSEYESMCYLTYREQLRILMLKNPKKAKYIRKYYTLINMISNIVFKCKLS